MTDAPDFNPSYVGMRRDIIRLLPELPGRVLDVGCATGELGAFLRNERGAEAWGIETDPAMAEIARPRFPSTFRRVASHTGSLHQSAP